MKIKMAVQITIFIPHKKRCKDKHSYCPYFVHYCILGEALKNQNNYSCQLFNIDKNNFTRLPECLEAERACNE